MSLQYAIIVLVFLVHTEQSDIMAAEACLSGKMVTMVCTTTVIRLGM